MKDKKQMVWIISIVCIILAVAFCAVSIVKMNRLQKQARDLLKELEKEGLLQVGRGRGGSRITEKGLKKLEKQK